MTINEALENIYTSLANNNKDIDLHIEALRTAMKAEEKKEVEIENARLVLPNREGRNMLKSYFKKRGVAVSFKL